MSADKPGRPWTCDRGLWSHPSGARIKRNPTGYRDTKPGNDWQALLGPHGWSEPTSLDVAQLIALAHVEGGS